MITAAALGSALLVAAQAVPVEPQSAAVATSISACELWLLDPASWANDVVAFGRDEGLQPQDTVPEVALPPSQFRIALHHWRVSIGEGGMYVTASDRLPICHLAGGGPFDLQPPVLDVLRAPAFAGRWKVIETRRKGEMMSERYMSTKDAKLTMTVSYAAEPGQRQDRVQFIATVQYQVGE